MRWRKPTNHHKIAGWEGQATGDQPSNQEIAVSAAF
jgi:hypothetical protein